MSPMSPRLLRPRASGLFNPASISTLQLWAEPSATRVFSNDAATTAANSGDGVAVVASRTGTNLVQTTQANRPQLVTNARAGRPCLRFDGLNDSLSFSTTLAITSGQQVFAVVDTTNLQTGGRVFLERTSGALANLALYLGLDQASQDRRPGVYWNNTRTLWGTALQTAYAVRWTYSTGTPASVAVQVNNGSPVTGSITASSLTNFASVANSAAQQASFDLFELLIFSSLTTADITTVNNYLMKKYAIT
jgi:hypothetical protein